METNFYVESNYDSAFRPASIAIFANSTFRILTFISADPSPTIPLQYDKHRWLFESSQTDQISSPTRKSTPNFPFLPNKMDTRQLVCAKSAILLISTPLLDVRDCLSDDSLCVVGHKINCVLLVMIFCRISGVDGSACERMNCRIERSS